MSKSRRFLLPEASITLPVPVSPANRFALCLLLEELADDPRRVDRITFHPPAVTHRIRCIPDASPEFASHVVDTVGVIGL